MKNSGIIYTNQPVTSKVPFKRISIPTGVSVKAGYIERFEKRYRLHLKSSVSILLKIDLEQHY